MGTVILKGLFAVGTKLLASMASEAVIKWALFYVADSIAKSTKTPHDDVFVAKIKAAYEGKA